MKNWPSWGHHLAVVAQLGVNREHPRALHALGDHLSFLWAATCQGLTADSAVWLLRPVVQPAAGAGHNAGDGPAGRDPAHDSLYGLRL